MPEEMTLKDYTPYRVIAESVRVGVKGGKLQTRIIYAIAGPGIQFKEWCRDAEHAHRSAALAQSAFMAGVASTNQIIADQAIKSGRDPS